MNETKPYKIITTIAKLPLETFINAFVDRDYAGLIIEGEVPEPLLLAVWNDLVDQYNEAISKGDEGQRQYVSAVQEYYRAKSKHDLAIKYIELLNAYFEKGIVVAKWIKDLNKLCDIRYKFNIEKKHELIPYLERCFNRNKANLIQYKLAATQLEELMKVQQVSKDDVATDRSYFIQIMLNLKSAEGREIPFTISTLEFCILVNRYRERLKEFQNKKKKTRNG